MNRTSPSSIALAALAAELTPGAAPGELRLIPAGNFRGRNGRPENLPHWTLTAAQAAPLIEAAKAQRDDFVIDYEHQTLNAETNGKPAPAAGWFSRLEWRDGDAAIAGLWATDVRWTANAARMIADGEYRYVSPVFAFDRHSGAVTALACAALVNTPCLDGLTDLQPRALAALSALFGWPADATHATHSPSDEKDAPMKTILAALGLALTASEDDAVAAIAALKTQRTDLGSEIAALKTRIDTPDPAKFVPVATMKAVSDELAALKNRQLAAEIDGEVAAALAAGKLQPAQEAWARSLGQSDLAALKNYIAVAVPIAAPGQTQTGGKAPAGVAGGGALDADGLAVCKALGLTPEEFNKGKKD